MIHSHKIGQKGEQAAANFLQKKGMKIIDRNWRNCSLELDIICKDKKNLVFVEVKTRSKTGLMLPSEALTQKKCRNIVKAAQAYLMHNSLWNIACRFDAICILIKEPHLELEYYPNVFDISEVMDCSNASWQPW